MLIGKGRDVVHGVLREICDGEKVNEQELRNIGDHEKQAKGVNGQQ